MVNFLFVEFGFVVGFGFFIPLYYILSFGFEKCNLCLQENVKNTVRIVVGLVFCFVDFFFFSFFKLATAVSYV